MSEKIDVEEERRLAASYVGGTDGPFVDTTRPTTELLKEYKDGHIIFQRKIDSLSAKYPRWRRLKGDGSCGFRALLFGFFESILKTKDTASLQVASNFLTEKWKSLSIDGIYETWLEEITELTARLDSVLSSGGDVEAALVSEFNDENQQREYIQFLRTLTATYIRKNRELYESSMEEGLDSWCQNHVEIPDAELDYISLNAAYAALFSDMGIIVNVHHVDLSAGSEANVHLLSPSTEPTAAVSKAKLTFAPVEMLYRPGHYDLVYGHE